MLGLFAFPFCLERGSFRIRPTYKVHFKTSYQLLVQFMGIKCNGFVFKSFNIAIVTLASKLESS